MNSRITPLYKSEFFELRKMKRRKSEKIYYEVRVTGWIPETSSMETSFYEQVRDMIDPLRNKSGSAGTHWKFRNLNDAEKIYTALVLRWT